MIAVLLWIVGCYALVAAAVHAASRVRSQGERKKRHYVLVAGNEQLRMEWYLQSLQYFSYFTGTEVKVTVIDNGSEDETMRIVRVFATEGMDVDIESGVRMESALNQLQAAQEGDYQGSEASGTQAPPIVFIDLKNPADVSKLPLF